MQPTNELEQRSRSGHRPRPLFRTIQSIAVLVLANAATNVLTAAAPDPAPSLAFARYVASAGEPSPFSTPGVAVVEIRAALPDLNKSCRILALRRIIDSVHSQYALLGFAGDAIVAQELVAPYFDLRDEIERAPLPSIAITPVNYKFRYVRMAGSGPSSAYVFRITPRKKRLGLIDGELWIDAAGGGSILQSGHFARTPPGFAGPPHVVREIRLIDGVPLIRVTHVTANREFIGRGELTITESRTFEAQEAIPLPAPAADLGAEALR